MAMPMVYELLETIPAAGSVSLTHARLTKITGDGSLPIDVELGTLDADGQFHRGPAPYDRWKGKRRWLPPDPGVHDGEFAAFRQHVRDVAIAAGAVDPDDVAFRPSDLAAWLDANGMLESSWEPAP